MLPPLPQSHSLQITAHKLLPLTKGLILWHHLRGKTHFFFTHAHRQLLWEWKKARSYSRSRQKFLAVHLYRLCRVNSESWIVKFLFANGYNSDKTRISAFFSDRSTSLTNSLKGKWCHQLNPSWLFNHLAFKWLEGCAIDLKIPSLKMTHAESKYNPTRYSFEIFN